MVVDCGLKLPTKKLFSVSPQVVSMNLEWRGRETESLHSEINRTDVLTLMREEPMCFRQLNELWILHLHTYTLPSSGGCEVLLCSGKAVKNDLFPHCDITYDSLREAFFSFQKLFKNIF